MGPIRLRRSVAARTLYRGQWLLAGESGEILIVDAAECAVVEAALRGGDREAMLRELEVAHPGLGVGDALERLERRGVIVPGGDTLPAAEAAHWENAGVPAAHAQALLQRATVTVEASCAAGAEEVREALAALGVRVVEDGAFTVLVLNDYLQQEAQEANRRLFAARRPWMLLKPVGREIWTGPILVPGVTACYECLRPRLMENRWMDVPFWVRGEALPPAPASLLATTPAMGAAMAAAEVARWLVAGSSPLAGALCTFDTLQIGMARHPVMRRTDCPICSSAFASAAAAGRPFSVEALGEHISPITGIFHDLGEVTPNAEDPVRLFAIRYTMPLETGDGVLAMRPPVAAGRGYTAARAQSACLAEAAERRSLFFRGGETRVRMSYREAGTEAFAPDQLLLFSPAQYRERERLNARYPNYFQIPEPWDAERAMDWTFAREVAGSGGRLVPSAFCYLRHSEPLFEGVDSNGCAAGATLGEATLHGFCELVEREAAGIWWYNRTARPRIRLSSLEDPHLLLMRDHFRREGNQFYLLDLTTDWEIPAVAAVCHDARGAKIRFAFASHPDAVRAANAAATELFQVVLARGGETGGGFVIPDAERVDGHPYLQPEGTVEWAVRAGQAPAVAERLSAYVARARELGLEVLWVDLTRADTGMPVVRVMVPGMRSRMPCFAAGRLYDVPVKLGWRSGALREEELNPVPMFQRERSG